MREKKCKKKREKGRHFLIDGSFKNKRDGGFAHLTYAPKKRFSFSILSDKRLLFRVPSRVVLSQVPDCVTKRGSVAVRFSKHVVIHGHICNPFCRLVHFVGCDEYGLLLLTRSIKFHRYVIIPALRIYQQISKLNHGYDEMD